MEEKTLPALLIRNHRRYGRNKTAMREKEFGIWQSYTWEDYYQRVKYFALGLASMGFGKGDKLAIIGGQQA